MIAKTALLPLILHEDVRSANRYKIRLTAAHLGLASNDAATTSWPAKPGRPIFWRGSIPTGEFRCSRSAVASCPKAVLRAFFSRNVRRFATRETFRVQR